LNMLFDSTVNFFRIKDSCFLLCQSFKLRKQNKKKGVLLSYVSIRNLNVQFIHPSRHADSSNDSKWYRITTTRKSKKFLNFTSNFDLAIKRGMLYQPKSHYEITHTGCNSYIPYVFYQYESIILATM